MAKPPAPSDTMDKFMLRLPDGMRERIAEAAKENNRSMNAEIVSRLEYSLKAVSAKPIADRMKAAGETFKLMSIDLLQITSYIKMLESYLDIVDPGGPRPSMPKPVMDDNMYDEIKRGIEDSTKFVEAGGFKKNDP